MVTRNKTKYRRTGQAAAADNRRRGAPSRGAAIALRRTWLLCLLFPLGLALQLYAMADGTFAELYTTSVQPLLRGIVGFVPGLLPFSLFEFLLVFAVSGVLVFGVIRIFQLLFSRRHKRFLLKRTAASVLAAGAVIYFMFVLLCGISYYRRPFSFYSGLVIEPYYQADAVAAAEEIIGEMNALRGELRGEHFTLSAPFSVTAKAATEALRGAGQRYAVLLGSYTPPKSVLLSRGMSYLDITGVYAPFTNESNVNTDVPDYLIPFTACHELAHQRGFMREDEANFIAYLACTGSGDAEFRYSGYASAFPYLLSAIRQNDDAEADRLYALLSPAVVADYYQNRDYWANFKTALSPVTTAVQDSYLKAQGQEAGVRSYSLMVHLMLAQHRADSLPG